MKDKTIKNSIFNIIKTVGTFIFPVITFSYVSRIFRTDGMGRINFAKSVIAVFSLISMLGIRYYGIRECAKKRDDKESLSRVFSELFGLNLLFTLLAYTALFIYLKLSAKAGGYRLEIGLYAFTLLLTVMSFEWLFIAVEDYKYLTIRSIASQLISLLAVVLLIHKKEDIYIYIIIQLLTAFVINVTGIIHIRKYLYFRRPRLSSMAGHIKPVMELFLVTMFIQIFTEMATLMLGYLSDDTEVGLYGAAYKISAVLCSFISAATTVIMPRMAYVLQNENEEKANELLKTAVQFILMVGIPLSAGSFIYSRNFILILSGEDFINAVPAAMILSLRTLLSPINGMLLLHYMIPRNKEKTAIIITAVTAAFNILANVLTIPVFGAMGAAISTVCAEMTEMICIVLAVRRYLKIGNVFGKCYQYLLCVIPVVMIAAAAGIYIGNIILSIFAGAALAAPVYFFILYRMKNESLLSGIALVKELIKRKTAHS